jgi:hypothetical protein
MALDAAASNHWDNRFRSCSCRQQTDFLHTFLFPPEYVPARVLEVTHLELCLGCIAERQSNRSGASRRTEE